MHRSRTVLGILAFLAVLVLALDGKTAVQGAREGIDLCIRTVIPSLFPFFILSGIQTSVCYGMYIPWLRPAARLCSLGNGMEFLLVPMFLGGYPVGGQTVAQMWRSGRLPQKEAQRLMTFCNNAGPSFLFGMVAAEFPDPRTAWLLWGIHILSALAVAVLFPGTGMETGLFQEKELSLPLIMNNAIRAMSSVCGFVILFRVLINVLDRWILWILPVQMRTIITGMLELVNGCMALADVADLRIRFVLCAFFLAFGGLCVMVQIISVSEGLPMKDFFIGKALHALFSVSLAAIAVGWAGAGLAFLVVFCGLALRKNRNNGSIPEKAGV